MWSLTESDHPYIFPKKLCVVHSLKEVVPLDLGPSYLADRLTDRWKRMPYEPIGQVASSNPRKTVASKGTNDRDSNSGEEEFRSDNSPVRNQHFWWLETLHVNYQYKFTCCWSRMTYSSCIGYLSFVIPVKLKGINWISCLLIFDSIRWLQCCMDTSVSLE